MTSEPTNRYQVQKRYNPAPPAPYENPWRPTWSFDDINDALECARDEQADEPKVTRVGYDYRVYDTVSQNSVPL